MNQPFLDLLKKRRTIYNLGRNVTLKKDELTAIIKEEIGRAHV